LNCIICPCNAELDPESTAAASSVQASTDGAAAAAASSCPHVQRGFLGAAARERHAGGASSRLSPGAGGQTLQHRGDGHRRRRPETIDEKKNRQEGGV